MSVVIATCLPLEVIRAIQAGELAAVLQEFGTVSTGPYHLIHDITRSVVTAVSAVPYNITPKTSPVDSSGLAYKFSTANLQDVGERNTPYPSQKPEARPLSATGGWGSETEIYEIDITIRDLMNNEEHFSGFSSHEPFQNVVAQYQERSGLASSAVSFTFNDRELSIDARLEDVLGICTYAIILAKPKKAQIVVGNQEITVIFQDSMKREEVITARADWTLNTLLIAYANRADEVSYAHFRMSSEDSGIHDRCGRLRLSSTLGEVSRLSLVPLHTQVQN